MRRLLHIALAAALLGPVLAPARALAVNAVDLAPGAQMIPKPEEAAYDLTIDFAQATLGGGIVITFDEDIASFVDFQFDASFPDEPALRLVCPSPAPGCTLFPGPGVLVAFANSSGISGAHTVGTITFQGTGPGITAVRMEEDDGVAGPFVPQGASFDAPTFSIASLEVFLAMPLPGWSLAIAALALAACLALLPARRAAAVQRASKM